MSTVTYREALIQAMGDALEEDQRVFLFGEDVGAAGGAFKLTDGLFKRFGAKRVRDTPISEQAIIGTAIGSALMGLRPLAEIMFADFAAVCFDGIANELAKYRYMTNGQVTLPVTIRMSNGAGGGFAAQHSQPVENWFLNIPGLKIVVPATPADAYGLLRAAIHDDDPVLFFEHKNLFNLKGELPDSPPVGKLGVAEVVRSGEHATVVATQLMRHRAVEAADLLAADGIEVEVIDPRTLIPFDYDAVASSIDRTARLVVVQESPYNGSWGASLVARLVGDRLEHFDAPPLLVGTDETPVPYSGPLEERWLPSVERIVDAVKRTVAY
jgi:acetoin:2,6-dichlorophenolindophenol oxidoreductase subunit beta